MQPLAASKSLRLHSELRSDLPEIAADANRLQQVFTNLLGNAIKFTPDGGTITVRAEVADGDIQFSVTDTGSGIPRRAFPICLNDSGRHAAQHARALDLVYPS